MKNNVHLASLFILIFLSGCFAGSLGGGKESLKKTASFYYTLLMWKYYDRASAFVDEEKRGKFEKLVLGSQNRLNITSYEIKEVTFEEDKKKSLVKVLMNYYKYPSVSEKAVLLEDTWILREGKWYIYSDFEDEMFN
jgi:hypothetical protein